MQLDRNDKTKFLAFCQTVLEHSFSQRFQDLWFLWETGFSREGYFCEFGALNGRDFSNTYILEKLGWNGALSEPHPDFAERVVANRNCYFSGKCIYSESDQTLTFNVVKGRPALSAISHLVVKDEREHLRNNYRQIPVQTLSLDDFLQEASAPETIDCLSIDTEGSELSILESYDFTRRPIRLICVEHNEVMRDNIYQFLTKKGYSRKWPDLSGHDDWYVLENAYPDWQVDSLNTVSETLLTFEKFEISLPGRKELMHSLTQSSV